MPSPVPRHSAAFAAPWDVPLPERMQALARGETAVAYFYEQPDDSTFRYRIYNMTQVLCSPESAVSASYFFHADLHRLPEIAETADMLIMCRTRYDHRVNRLINAFRRRGKRVLFDIDDLVFDTDYGHLIQWTLDQDLRNPAVWDDWFAYSSRLGTTLRLCDGAITTNDYLAVRIADYADVPVAVVPNYMNREQLAVSEPIFAARRKQNVGEDGTIRLGYFSGSPSHNRDFAIVAPALETVMQEDPRLKLVVAGYIEPGPLLARFGDRVEQHPFCDFLALQRLVGSVAFNLVPLQYNAFTNCKSELKYFEAAIVGTQTIASPTFTYARAIRHGDNGYLAQAHQWIDRIRVAVGDLAGFDAMAQRSYDDARTKYSWFNQRECVLAALGLG
jgi:glycosyltransferase involved in cell wall biosynthesis